MKFSILLPTRNRLEYLRLAVQSVLRQDRSDWELVVSDNSSEQDIQGYISSLADPRIVYTRTDRVLPVTENWNRALAASSGEYIIMLGDDDALLDGYLRRMEELTREFAEPDLIYTKALLFTYPGVDPSHPGGFLTEHGCAEFVRGAGAAFVLERERALAVVRATMRFQLRFDFNAQFALVSRRLIQELGEYGDFYQSDFPDYYSMNAAFLRARTIVVDPSPRVVIGVTPKSYGYFHVNAKEDKGRAFLNGAQSTAPPGTNINVGWLSAATALERGIGRELGLRVNRRRYRFYQAANVYGRLRSERASAEEVGRLEAELPLLERWAYRSGNAALVLVERLLPERLLEARSRLATRLVGQLPRVTVDLHEGRYRDVLDVCEARPADRSGAAP